MDAYYIGITRSCLHGAAGKLEQAQSYAVQAGLPGCWPETAHKKLVRLLNQVRKLSDELQEIQFANRTVEIDAAESED